jgi:tRNA A-37 threonylcarbamoyl transferase component Bud32
VPAAVRQHLDQAVTLSSKAESLAPAAPDGMVVTGSLGAYVLLSEIERGGMGIVYEARERTSGQLVALKMMLAESASGSGDLRRFILEARATGELNHPGVVAIHDWGEHQRHPFYTMDFVPGVTLSRLLEKGPLPWERAVRYLLGIARAVGAAHAGGIVHRDLKPGNVIIDLSDQPRVLDFGLAKRQCSAGTDGLARGPVLDALPADAPDPALGAARRTEKGAILGTPSYMAPEQVRAEHERVGPAADVHALGAMFYEMLTGRPPFQGQGTYDTLMQVLEKEPAPVRAQAPHVPAVLDELCRRCLEKDPSRRYPNANALADDLERRRQRAVRGVRFARLAVAAGLALLVLAAARLVLHAAEPAGLAGLARAAGESAHASEPVRQAAGVLAPLLETVVLGLAPYLAELGLLLWLVGWARSAERPWRIAAGCGAAALAVAALSLGDGLESLHEGPLFLAELLAVNTLVLTGVCLGRTLQRAERTEAEGTRAPAEPYLQRLFTVRSEAGRRPAAPAAAGLADFELGKLLHRWDDHEVCWARQKSLDRPTLVWTVSVAASGQAAGVPDRPLLSTQYSVLSTQFPPPCLGVAVRHPAVLGLHAVGSCADRAFLATEPATASPLAEVVQQRGLLPLEAAALTARIARAIQAFHDQGACHGRLSPDWILARGDLEPVLCPCGFPSLAPEDRARDVLALGRMLREWLPAHTRGWGGLVLAPLNRVADAAVAGAYARPGDLATDLERAAEHVRIRWREQLAHVLVLILLASGLLLPLVARALGAAGGLSEYLILALAPATMLLGYTHGRVLLRWAAERGRPIGGRTAGLSRRAVTRLALVVLLGVVAALVGWFNLPAAGGASAAGSVFLVVTEFAGFWFVGVCLALLATFAQLLVRSLQPMPLQGAEP